MTRRTLAVWLVIVSSILSFSVTLTAASGKTIPFDEVNHRLETVLQELSRTAQARPLALSQLAQDRGIALAGGDSITVIIEPISGNASRIERAAVRALGGTIEATSKNLIRVRVPISQLEAMADKVNGIAFIRPSPVRTPFTPPDIMAKGQR